MTLKGQNGQDPTNAIVEQARQRAKRVTRDAMTVWHTEAQKRIMEAAHGRAGIDSEGKQQRQNNNLHELAQSFTTPQWSDEKDAWVFSVTNRFANIHEWGAQPHEIKAKEAQALVFEWPDAPEEIKEQFEDTFPKVFFSKVEHPGVPGIGYLRHGREKARQRLKKGGFDTRTFARKLEDD